MHIVNTWIVISFRNGSVVLIIYHFPTNVFVLLGYDCLQANNLQEQECIPVGCIVPTSVAITRCQYQRVEYPFPIPGPMSGVSTDTPPTYPLPRRDLGPAMPTPWKGLGTKNTPIMNRHTSVKTYVPATSLVGGN